MCINSINVIPPSEGYLAAYQRMRQETIASCKEQYILPEYPFAPPPAGFVPSEWRWAVLGGEVVGVLNVRPKLNDALKRWGGNVGVAVSVAHRGRGIGRRLLEIGVRIAREGGAPSVRLTIDRANEASLNMTFASVMMNGWTATITPADVDGRKIVLVDISFGV